MKYMYTLKSSIHEALLFKDPKSKVLHTNKLAFFYYSCKLLMEKSK